MPSPHDPDDPEGASREATDEGRRLRDLSDRLIAAIGTIRRLEHRSRELPIGSPEFEDVSKQITDRVHSVFLMSAEQEALGTGARVQERTINEISPDDGVAPDEVRTAPGPDPSQHPERASEPRRT